MTISIEVLEAEVLSPPQGDRLRLVDRRLASPGHDSEWQQAWAAEADRREAQIAGGQAQWLEGPVAVARVRAERR